MPPAIQLLIALSAFAILLFVIMLAMVTSNDAKQVMNEGYSLHSIDNLNVN